MSLLHKTHDRCKNEKEEKNDFMSFLFDLPLDKKLEFAKYYFMLILANIFLFHIDKLMFNLVLISLFVGGYVYYLLKSEKLKQIFSFYMTTRRKRASHSGGFLKLSGFYELLNETDIEFGSSSAGMANASRVFQFDQKSITNMKPNLTDSFLADEELHKIVELIIRYYVESWYKQNISNKEDFSYSVRVLIFSSIRQINQL
jgi:hypothetical protein